MVLLLLGALAILGSLRLPSLRLRSLWLPGTLVGSGSPKGNDALLWDGSLALSGTLYEIGSPQLQWFSPRKWLARSNWFSLQKWLAQKE